LQLFVPLCFIDPGRRCTLRLPKLGLDIYVRTHAATQNKKKNYVHIATIAEPIIQIIAWRDSCCTRKSWRLATPTRFVQWI